MAFGHLAEHGEVEVHQWLAFFPESFVLASGLDFDDGLDGGHLDAEFFGEFLEVTFGEGAVAHGVFGLLELEAHGVLADDEVFAVGVEIAGRVGDDCVEAL